jgi:serine/threonine protein kinase
MLVFEYVENKNLAQILSLSDPIGSVEPPSLDWSTRFNIIVGTARGLAYLHEDLQPPVIHRDIKASNILLNMNYNPKIADFGLAYLFPGVENEATHLTLMQVAGTRGYCSPEYALHGHISTALDVYSFGILTLEVVSGRKSIDLSKPEEEMYIREWARRQFKAQEIMTLIDSKMQHSSTDLEAIRRVIGVALASVQYKAANRPKMHDVVPMLLGSMPLRNFDGLFKSEEGLGDIASNFTTTSNTTSSLGDNENFCMDESCLLSNACNIEMDEIA